MARKKRNVKESRNTSSRKLSHLTIIRPASSTQMPSIDRSQLMFRSCKHEVHTIEVNKVALNRDDNKRISKKDGISTLAHGHKSLSWSPILGELLLI